MELGLSGKGKYKLQVIRPDSVDTYEFENLLTNNFANAMISSFGSFTSVFFTCEVGTGNVTPDVTDTSLSGSILGSVSASQDRDTNSRIDPNDNTKWLLSFTVRFEFNLGSVVGNVAEVGISPITSSSLASRALTVDSGGNPSAISVTSEDQLVVDYEVTLSTPLSTTITTDIDGVSTQVNMYLAATNTGIPEITSLENFLPNYLNGSDSTPRSLISYGVQTSIAYPTPLNTPFGTEISPNRISPLTTTPGSMSGRVRYGVSQANDSNGIGRIVFSNNSSIFETNHAWVIDFNPPVNKADGEVFEIEAIAQIINS